MTNIWKCKNCNGFLIDEEKEAHECLVVKDFKIGQDSIRVSDGKNWYSLKLSPGAGHRDEITGDWDRAQHKD